MDINVEKTEIKKTSTHRIIYRTEIIFGVILILLGGLLISAKLGVIPDNMSRVFISWQMLLIVIGIVSVSKRFEFSGIFVIMLGSFLIIPRLAEVFPATFFWVNEQFLSDYWAVLLVFAGILIVIYWIVTPRKKWHNKWSHGHVKHCHRDKKHFEINGEFSASHVFSSGTYIVLEPEFKGGKTEVVFGSTEIDLRKTSLPEGDICLEIAAVFSGVVLFIPDDWRIETQIECVFSGVSDERSSVASANSTRKLILVGSCVFSGCEIKS